MKSLEGKCSKKHLEEWDLVCFLLKVSKYQKAQFFKNLLKKANHFITYTYNENQELPPIEKYIE